MLFESLLVVVIFSILCIVFVFLIYFWFLCIFGVMGIVS